MKKGNKGNNSNRVARSNAFRESTTKNQSTYERDGFTFYLMMRSYKKNIYMSIITLIIYL